MSELKATSSGEIRTRNALLGYWWYEKSEADKVIAELKAQKAQAEDDCAYWKMNERNAANAMHETEEYALQLYNESRHHKYKRCLDMAYKCVVLCQKSKDLYRWAENENLEHHYNRKIEFYARWHERWLELAEHYKESK